MPKFPSEEWAEALCHALNQSAEYKSAAAKWEGDILFIMTAVPQHLAVGRTVAMKLKLRHGACLGSETYIDDEVRAAEAPYVLEADYNTWVEVITGKIQPIPAMVLGKIKIRKGSFSVLAQYATAALAIIKEAQRIGVQ